MSSQPGGGPGAPINDAVPSALNYDVRFDKYNAKRFTVTVKGGPVKYQLNVPAFGRGESWQPMNGAYLEPGFWTFDEDDWAEYGVAAQGIRFATVDTTRPATISVT